MLTDRARTADDRVNVRGFVVFYGADGEGSPPSFTRTKDGGALESAAAKPESHG